MGVSRSASTVIAYAMKEYGWSLEKAYNFVKQKRSITRPNAGFMRQLAEYEGILDARWGSARGQRGGGRRLHGPMSTEPKPLKVANERFYGNIEVLFNRVAIKKCT